MSYSDEEDEKDMYPYKKSLITIILIPACVNNRAIYADSGEENNMRGEGAWFTGKN